ncbi:helix-turn-helix transcriptional regulator [Vibrio astriarenae]
MHPDVEVDEQPTGYLYKIKKGKLHPLNLGKFSSVAVLQLVEEQIRTMLPPSLHDEILGLFDQVHSRKSSQYELWKKHFCFASTEFRPLPSVINAEIFSVIEDAIQRERDLTIEYIPNKEQQLKQYHLTPKGVVLNGSDTYVIGYSHTSGGYRNFAFHRIDSINSHFRTPGTYQNDEFCLRTYVENDRLFGGEDIEVTLKINRANGLHFLHNKKIGESQCIVEESDEYVVIKARVKNSFDLKKWLIKYADTIQVLAPKELQGQVIGSLNFALNQYNELDKTS